MLQLTLKDRVKQTSTTTGTGDIALSGTIASFDAFASALGTGDQFPYEIHAVDSAGVPTGDWEVGFATFNAGATSFSRDEVIASSTGTAKVNFAAGTKHVSLTMPAILLGGRRKWGGTGMQLYVRTDGNDANTGRANTAGGAFLTLLRAVQEVEKHDFAANAHVTITVGAGTFTSHPDNYPIEVSARNQALVISIEGQGVDSTYLSGYSNVSNSLQAIVIDSAPGVSWEVSNLRLTVNASEAVNLAYVSGRGGSVNFTDVKITGCRDEAFYVSGPIQATFTNITLMSNIGGAVFSATEGARIIFRGDFTAASAVTVGQYVALWGPHCYGDLMYGTFINKASVTGMRYICERLSFMDTDNGGDSFLPGTVAGTTATGGVYA